MIVKAHNVHVDIVDVNVEVEVEVSVLVALRSLPPISHLPSTPSFTLPVSRISKKKNSFKIYTA